MTEYKMMLSLLISIMILLCVVCSVVSRIDAQESDTQGVVLREQFPGHIRSMESGRTANTLTPGAMETYSEYTDKNYIHSEVFSGKKVYNGVDISAKQKGINWIVLSEHIDFAFIRTGYRGYSEGVLYEDKMFDVNMRCAQKMGVKKGVYFYSQAISCDEIREEARLVLECIEPYEIELPVVLDFEYAEVGGGQGGRLYDADLSPQQVTEMCQTFCEVIRRAGYTPMIYANSNMMHNMIDDSAVDGAIWIAYPAEENGYDGIYACWQYSWTGHVAGIRGEVDCNYIYADELSCAAFEQRGAEEVDYYALF